ncbi:hypothetical protein CPLU01_03771 [Colletotrichum plurivorum]|uniref:Uncharacterized protein n=1 Tax=Colletotrichum plurivorum TaxID=2175906 RepID=A0A8H6KSG1_9PEZI|nr:hypothetical protein CPLU01_03771 [Colletotrichum plurivorum]
MAVDGPDFVMVHGRRVPHRGREDEEQERKEGREMSRKVLIPVPVVPPPVQVRYFALRCAQPTRRRGAVSGIPRTSRIASRASCWRGAAKTSEQGTSPPACLHEMPPGTSCLLLVMVAARGISDITPDAVSFVEIRRLRSRLSLRAFVWKATTTDAGGLLRFCSTRLVFALQTHHRRCALKTALGQRPGPGLRPGPGSGAVLTPKGSEAGRCDYLHEVVDAETEELVAPPPEMRSERGPTSSRRQLGGGGGG